MPSAGAEGMGSRSRLTPPTGRRSPGSSGFPVQPGSHPRTPAAEEGRPVIRVLHTLARTGGTVIGKCLGVMPSVVMLSEVNPAVTALVQHPLTQRTPEVMRLLRQMVPLYQAHNWFKLLTPEDVTTLKARQDMPPFDESIALIQRRAAEQNKTLLLRDWSHLDYAAAPFLARPTFRRSTALALASKFRPVCAAFVRHPIDQWLSIQNVPMLRQRLTLEVFLEGYRRFAREALDLGFIRYEDFTQDPDAEVAAMCAKLELPFDPAYRERWAAYTFITGDTKGTRAQTEIVSLPRRPIEQSAIDAFGSNADYRAAIEMLGYPHP